MENPRLKVGLSGKNLYKSELYINCSGGMPRVIAILETYLSSENPGDSTIDAGNPETGFTLFD